MGNVKELKTIQIEGKKHVLPAEDVEIEKLIQKGLSFEVKLDEIEKEYEEIKSKLIEIATRRREGTTTVTMKGISGGCVVTFRETLELKNDVGDLKQPLGPLFQRFFEEKTTYKPTSDFKEFMKSEHGLGIKDADNVKKEINKYTSMKSTKPNVKLKGK